ncbi:MULTISPECIES: hypothetical protein [unclassified Nonomuraea]|uniref:hypothetical protein n=1 Tax=unclassified Nonomuraea TaxID=2593643 RepID=UPI00191BCCAF|nr:MULTISPECIES: hypothetical protein [unclassified Nonomuraea]
MPQVMRVERWCGRRPGGGRGAGRGRARGVVVVGPRALHGFFARGELDESAVLPTVEQVTGRPPRTFGQWAAANAEAAR